MKNLLGLVFCQKALREQPKGGLAAGSLPAVVLRVRCNHWNRGGGVIPSLNQSKIHTLRKIWCAV